MVKRELFLLEHKKLWKKKGVRISVLLCVLYIVLLGSILTHQWITFGSSKGWSGNGGKNFDGYQNIRDKKAYAAQHGTELTDEMIQTMVEDYQREERAAEAAYKAKDAAGEAQHMREEGRIDWSMLNAWIRMLYPELEDQNETYPTFMIGYVEPAKLTGFYERRQQAVEDALDLFSHTEKEKEFLLKMNDEVSEPFPYCWAEGWSTLLADQVSDFGVVMAVFLVIALSTVFSGEWHNGMGTLVLTTKNGRKEIAHAKILSGLVFTLEFFGILMAGSVAGQLFFLGTEGWNLPIQYVKLMAVAPMNMLQAEIYEYVFFLLGAVGLAALVMFFSAAVRNNFFALVCGLAVVYVPMMMQEYVPVYMEKYLELIPLSGSPTDIFRTNVFHIFGHIVWSPWVLITVPVVLGCMFIPFTVKRWAGRS